MCHAKSSDVKVEYEEVRGGTKHLSRLAAAETSTSDISSYCILGMQ